MTENRLESGDAAPRVTGLFIYPLKGARGIPLERARLDELGFRHDRRWMVVDAAGDFVSQRTRPRLALVRPTLAGDALVLEAPGCPPLELPTGPAGAAQEPVRLFDQAVPAAPVGAEADAWISAALGLPARIVAFPRGGLRPVDPRYARRATDRVAFVDGYPCLLISQGSLDGLNARLAVPVPMDRFRPNLVVAGTEPHAEDGWRRIRIGEVLFHVVKPCARCTVPAVDQATGRAGPEPLRTLARYRKVGSKVLFGQNLIHEAPGTVALGQAVAVEEEAVT